MAVNIPVTFVFDIKLNCIYCSFILYKAILVFSARFDNVIIFLKLLRIELDYLLVDCVSSAENRDVEIKSHSVQSY